VAGAAQVVELRHDGELASAIAYTFDPDRYTVDVRMAVSGVGEQTPTWSSHCRDASP
jgi:hypothetical protein